MHSKWERSNLEKYVVYDKKKWRYSDQDKDGLLNRQEYEYFHHPKEHEIMLPYIAVVGVNKSECFCPELQMSRASSCKCLARLFGLASFCSESKWQVQKSGLFLSKITLFGIVKLDGRRNLLYIKRYLQELMDKYDLDHDGRLSLDEYLGEFSPIYLHYLRTWSILIDFTLQALRELAFQDSF